MESFAVLIAKNIILAILYSYLKNKLKKTHKNVCFNSLLFLFYHPKWISVSESFTPNNRCKLYHVAGFKNSPSLNFSVVVIFWSFYTIESILYLYDEDKISIWHFTQAPLKD
jgi:hypothetical protein